MQVLVVNRRLGSAKHLVERFFGHISATPPGPGDQQFVHDHLSDACASLFWSQNGADQDHAVGVARCVQAALGDDREAVEAALLHDIGKSDVSIGPIARSLATMLDTARLPMTGRMRRYRNHGPRGAAMLEEAGCEPLAVAFALHHPGPPPKGIDPVRWDALSEADG